MNQCPSLKQNVPFLFVTNGQSLIQDAYNECNSQLYHLHKD